MKRGELEEGLRSLSWGEVVAFLVELYVPVPKARDLIEALRLRGNVQALSEQLQDRIDRLRRDTRFIAYVESSRFALEIDALGSDIAAFIPLDSHTAFRLTAALLTRDSRALNRVPACAESVYTGVNAHFESFSNAERRRSSVAYIALLEFAKHFERERHWVASVACYRASLNDVLVRAYAKVYSHAAAYPAKLQQIDLAHADLNYAPLVQSWTVYRPAAPGPWAQVGVLGGSAGCAGLEAADMKR
jgi:hypothetical protein